MGIPNNSCALRFKKIKSYTRKEIEDDLEKEMHEEGMPAVFNKLRTYVNTWKDIELHIAVTGRAGAGKSSFINAFIGLHPKDEGAAKAGNIESTTERQTYKHPENPSFIVWDLPGVGTPNMTQDVYLEAVKFEQYDFFIILSKDRFTAEDLWLAKTVQEQKKVVFFVRSNIDIALYNYENANGKDCNKAQELKAIRQNTEESLRKNGVKNARVFLINNWVREQFDFGELNDELLASCDDFKKNSMALSLAAITKKVMTAKRRALQDRIVPVVLNIVCSNNHSEEKRLFKDEMFFYQKQFNIDESTLAVNRDILFLSKENIQAFRIVFEDDRSSGKEMLVTTPTAKRQEASLFDRFVDWFRWTDENKLLYKYCKTALEYNLETLYRIACSLYDEKCSLMMVHALD